MIDRDNVADIRHAIVGTLLRIPECVGETLAVLPKDAFAGDPTGTVYDAISGLFCAGKPVDAVAVQFRTGEEYADVIKRALGYQCLFPEELRHYCEMLLEYTRLEEIQILAAQLVASGSMEEAQVYIDKINAITSNRPGMKAVSMVELVARYLQRKRSHQPPPEYVTFGMKALDEMLFVERGDLVVVGGYSSAGKTLLSLQFALHMAKKYRVGYFSLETKDKKLADRAISHYAKVSFRDIKKGTESEEDLSRVEKMGMELAELPGCFNVHPLQNVSVRDIQTIALSQRYDVVFIDYMQLLQAGGRSNYEKVTNVSLALRTMSQQHGITVVALAQLSRPEKSKGVTAPPTMWDFKESGQIENDADVAMLLYPSDPKDNYSPRVLKIGKNKDGERAEILLKFDGAHQTLQPYPPSVAAQIRAAQKAIREANRKSAEKDSQVTFEELDGEDKEIPF